MRMQPSDLPRMRTRQKGGTLIGPCYLLKAGARVVRGIRMRSVSVPCSPRQTRIYRHRPRGVLNHVCIHPLVRLVRLYQSQRYVDCGHRHLPVDLSKYHPCEEGAPGQASECNFEDMGSDMIFVYAPRVVSAHTGVGDKWGWRRGMSGQRR